MKRHSPRSAWLASRPTGASANAMPRAAASAAIRSVTSGSIVLISTTMLPFFARLMTPSCPPMTSATAAVVGSIVKITSLVAATSAAPAAISAPRPTSARTASPLTSWTSSVSPLRTRLEAIGLPMFPSPMNPTFILYRGTASRRTPSRRRLRGPDRPAPLRRLSRSRSFALLAYFVCLRDLDGVERPAHAVRGLFLDHVAVLVIGVDLDSRRARDRHRPEGVVVLVLKVETRSLAADGGDRRPSLGIPGGVRRHEQITAHIARQAGLPAVAVVLVLDLAVGAAAAGVLPRLRLNARYWRHDSNLVDEVRDGVVLVRECHLEVRRGRLRAHGTDARHRRQIETAGLPDRAA